MNIDFDYLRHLLFQIEANSGDLFIPDTLDREIRKERCAQILLNKGYLNPVNEQCYCLTEPGYDFLDSIRDESVWATLKHELAASGSNKTSDLITLVENNRKMPSDVSRAPSSTGKEMDISPHNRNGQKEKLQYEVALSFAGEQREYVEDVARALQSQGIAVFYDDFEIIRLWGKHLVEELHDVYEHRASYAVMFISREYVDKAWPSHERQSILSRAVGEKKEYVLPVRFDDTPVPGIPTAISYVSARDHLPAALAAMIAEKIGVQPFEGKASEVPPPRSTSLSGMAVFDYSSHNGRYVIGRGMFEFETKWSKASNRSIHVYNDPPSINGVALAKGYKSIEQISNAASLDYTSRHRTPQCGEIVVLRNVNGFYAAIQVTNIKDDTLGDERDELRFQYVILANGTDDSTTSGEKWWYGKKAVALYMIAGLIIGVLSLSQVTPKVSRFFQMLPASLKGNHFYARYSFKTPPFVHPKIIDDLTGQLSDTGDQVVAINLLDSQSSNRYFGEFIVNQEEYSRGRSWPWVMSFDGVDNGKSGYGSTPFYAYRYLGATKSGIDVLHTKFSGGGSAVFHNVILIRMKWDAGVEYSDMRVSNAGHKAANPEFRERELIWLVGRISLGDRWEGTLSVEGDDIVVRGRDVYERCKVGGNVSVMDAVEMSYFMDLECVQDPKLQPPAARAFKAPSRTE